MGINKQEFNNLKFYIAEKERLLKEIDIYCNKISNGYRSQDFTIPHSKNVNNDIIYNLILKNSFIQEEIGKRVKKIDRIIIKLYKIINKIKDPELKTIVELRAINGLTWEQIGEEIHMDSSGTRKKYIRFIESK